MRSNYILSFALGVQLITLSMTAFADVDCKVYYCRMYDNKTCAGEGLVQAFTNVQAGQRYNALLKNVPNNIYGLDKPESKGWFSFKALTISPANEVAPGQLSVETSAFFQRFWASPRMRVESEQTLIDPNMKMALKNIGSRPDWAQFRLSCVSNQK